MGKFDHVVIGAGIVGSCTAWHLAKNHRKVLLLDQFALPHTRGSSHGQTRLIRSCYAEKHFAAMMPDAFAIWKEIEKEAGTELIVNTGCLMMTPSAKDFAHILENMDKYCGGQYEIIPAEDMGIKFPLMRYSSNHKALLDKTGGVVLANKALSVVQNLFRKAGGTLLDCKQVHSIDLNDQMIKVAMQDDFSVTTPSLVVCAGAWTPKIFKQNNEDISLRLKSCLQGKAVTVYYWKCKEYIEPRFFQTFLDSSPFNVYGLSPVEYPGLMKVCVHGGIDCDPDEREKAEGFNEDAIKKYVEEHLPGLEPEPAIKEKCMYTSTPDENFVLDYLYEHKNVVLGCGFSGGGFKTSPLVGKILCEMAMGKQPSHDVPEFKLSRFQ